MSRHIPDNNRRNPPSRPQRAVQALRLVRGADRVLAPSVLTIGTFDGLHVGHAALIARTCVRAAELGFEAGLLSFEPMPREVLTPEDPPARLTNFRERWRLLADSGLTRFHLLTFNSGLRSKAARNSWRCCVGWACGQSLLAMISVSAAAARPVPNGARTRHVTTD